MKKVFYAVIIVIPLIFIYDSSLRKNSSSFRDAPADLPNMEELKNLIPQTQNLPTPSLNKEEDYNSSQEIPLTMGPSADQKAKMLSHNGKKSKGLKLEGLEPIKAVYRPFADYEKTGYLIVTSEFRFQSKQAKMAAAQILPPEGKLIVITNPNRSWEKDEALAAFTQVIPRDRIKFAETIQAPRAFWARDAMPVPVISKENGSFAVIDALYYHEFNQDSMIAGMFGAKLEKHDYYFEGGNFMANDKGVCIMVNHGQHTLIPDSVFLRYYGCEKMIRLPFVDGIGHIDEHVRFVSADTVLTDLREYKDLLEKEGLKAKLLPKPSGPYETYVNSLIIEGKAVVPVFNRQTDAEALRIYEEAGLKPQGANSSSLSNSGQGSVHCITMTYPPVPLKELSKALNLRIID